MIETELCAFSTEACRIAARNGVTRVELCTSPYEGGTTPSAAAIRAARRIEGLQLSVMIRPRGGDFLYTDEEFEQMLEEVRFARACGADGMVAGQVLDTLYGIHTEEQLKAMYRLKTGVMISGAAELGCVAADMPADMRAQAVEFADRLGLAFQIRDDMLDVVGDQQVFGKPIGSDKEEGKITYVDVDGLEGCARAVESCTQKAKDAVAHWPEHDFLFALADQLVDRKK